MTNSSLTKEDMEEPENVASDTDTKEEKATSGDAKKFVASEDDERYRPFLEQMKKALMTGTAVEAWSLDVMLGEEAPYGIVVDELSYDSGSGIRLDYWYDDIDEDGYNELIFGSPYIVGQGDQTNSVYGLVTEKTDGYKIVAAGWSRNTLWYLGNGVFKSSGSGGATLHIDSIFKYDGEQDELIPEVQLITEYLGEDPQYSVYAEGWERDESYSNAYEDPNAWHGEDAKSKWEEYNSKVSDYKTLWTNVEVKNVMDFE